MRYTEYTINTILSPPREVICVYGCLAYEIYDKYDFYPHREVICVNGCLAYEIYDKYDFSSGISSIRPVPEIGLPRLTDR